MVVTIDLVGSLHNLKRGVVTDGDILLFEAISTGLGNTNSTALVPSARPHLCAHQTMDTLMKIVRQIRSKPPLSQLSQRRLPS